MDIYERYSDFEIESIRELIDSSLEEKGVERTLGLIEAFHTQKAFWKTYDEDRKKEKESKNSNNKKNEYDDLIEAIIKPFVGPKTEKMDEDKEEALREGTKELEKIWDIASNDEETKIRIAEAIDELDYDEEDIVSRMNVSKCIISAVKMLKDAEKHNADFGEIYDSVNNKLKEVNFRDFAITYLNSDRRYLCTNPRFKETMINKIKEMANYEFAYFLFTTEDGMDGHDKQILEAKKNKTESCDSNFVNEVYNDVRLRNMPKIEEKDKNIEDKRVIDKVEALYKNDNPEQMLELFSTLTDTELLRYFMHYKDSIQGMNKDIINSNEMAQKIVGLSRKNMIVLVEAFFQKYIDYELLEINDEDGAYWAEQLRDPMERIFNEAKNRKLVTNDLATSYSAEEARLAKEKIEFYSEIDTNIPHRYVSFDSQISKDEQEQDYRSVDEILEGRYDEADNEIKEILSLYYVLDKLSNTPDLKMLQEVNKYNLKYRMSQFKKDTKNSQKYLINYFKKRIIGLPTSYGSFLQIIEGGCLNDAMELKAEELQEKLLNENDGKQPNNED